MTGVFVRAFSDLSIWWVIAFGIGAAMLIAASVLTLAPRVRAGRLKKWEL